MEKLEKILDFLFYNIIIPIFDFLKPLVLQLFDKVGVIPGIVIILLALALLSGLLQGLLDWIREILGIEEPTIAEREGQSFESGTSAKIKYLLKENPIENILFPHNDATTELDMAFVNEKGIFCFECKKRGKEKTAKGYLSDDVWEIWDSSYTKSTMKNPIYQNNGHLRAMEEVFPSHLKTNLYNIVCMDSKYDFMYKAVAYNKSFNVIEQNKWILVRLDNDGFNDFKDYIKSLPNVYTKEQVKEIQDFLKKYKATKKQMKEHVRNIKLKEYYKSRGWEYPPKK